MALALAACADGPGTETRTAGGIRPPTWIQGTYVDWGGQQWIFTNDDVVQRLEGGLPADDQFAITESYKAQPGVSWSQSVTSDTYVLTAGYAGLGYSKTYTWVRTSDGLDMTIRQGSTTLSSIRLTRVS